MAGEDNRTRCKKCGEEVSATWTETGTFMGYWCDTCDDDPSGVIHEHLQDGVWSAF